MMFPETRALVIEKLQDVYSFKIKAGNKLRGRCPDCNHKEASAWVYPEEPWVVFCPRKNQCGHENHVRDLFPELFEKWEKRFTPTPENPNKTVEAYLTEGRGFPLDQLKALSYSQEYYKSQEHNKGSITLRFPITDQAGNEGWWQRILDDQGILQKTTFKFGWESKNHAWLTPNTNYIESKEIWITEGIFDTIALWLSGITSVSALSCNNYPSIFLEHLKEKCHQDKKSLPKLIWAFDNDPAGHAGIFKNIEKAIEQGFECEAALPPSNRKKTDWNDLYKQDRLGFHDVETYKYYGALLVAEKAVDKGILIYKHKGTKSFPFDFNNQVYWFKLDMDKYDDYLKNINFETDDNEDWLQEEKDKETSERRDAALLHATEAKLIMDCRPRGLYYQYMAEIDEADYYFQIDFPRGAKTIKNTFSASHISSASEFKKRLLHVAPGKFYKGNSTQLDAFLERELTDIKRVELINYVGYHAEHKTYVLSDIAYHNGKQFLINKEDYFELPRHTNLKCKAPFSLNINSQMNDYKKEWVTDFIGAYGVRGLISLTAFFGSLYAQQIRKRHKSFPFFEAVGEPGTGKSTLLLFLWKLFGRIKYEGVDPVKSTKSGLIRTFRQVSNLPVVLVESERENDRGVIKQFDWDSLKTLFDGGSLGAQGVKNGGNETYEPPFMGTVIVSQNAEVASTTPIMERIVQTKFVKEQLTKNSLYASRRLEKYEPQDVSQFILKSLAKESDILQTYEQGFNKYDAVLHDEKYSIRSSRVVQNHSQFMALFDALCTHIVDVPKQIQEQVHAELIAMAQTRDKVIKSDSIMVQNFWNTFEEIESSIPKLQSSETNLNHSAKTNLIAINFPHLYKVAADYRYSLPELNELQTALRHSIHYRFLEVNKAIQSKITNTTKRCWIFEKPVSQRD
ncbi:toprim domain-containing protein [Acinetobacter rathckeae]|uniref:toprim domain-containing protein n=1 Tax=Acinetobacter rathckeae TaxID=2605272 RepID=UPI0018A2FF3B|nr:toprim domain-containing protein [Acinetobacter rathckeae]MBF7687716.1 toprim domain-containing protein [Acinetobacter rathckeae]MBF7688061.1 toprim domain-containing protein [Acinetobacter rathckeae]